MLSACGTVGRHRSDARDAFYAAKSAQAGFAGILSERPRPQGVRIQHESEPVRVAALDASLGRVRPHRSAVNAETVTLPTGTPEERVRARGAAVAGLLDIVPGTTVYRTLQALERSGTADVVRDEVGERLYRYRRPDVGHCHYLLCRRCRRHEPLDTDIVEHWIAAVVRSTGFAEVEHTLELTGICVGCRTAERGTVGQLRPPLAAGTVFPVLARSPCPGLLPSRSRPGGVGGSHRARDASRWP